MPELATDFQSLPDEYQLVIRPSTGQAARYWAGSGSSKSQRVSSIPLDWRLSRSGLQPCGRGDSAGTQTEPPLQPHLCSVPQRSTQYVAEELLNCPRQRRSCIGTRRDLRLPHLECGWLLPPWCRLGQHWEDRRGSCVDRPGAEGVSRAQNPSSLLATASPSLCRRIWFSLTAKGWVTYAG